MTTTRDTAIAGPHPGRMTPRLDPPEQTRRNGHPRKARFGPNTPRVLQFLINLRNLSPAQIDVVTSTWNQASSLDRALARAHLATAAKHDSTVMAAASAARRAAMQSARVAGHDDWAFWAAAWDAAAAVAVDDLADGDYQTLTRPLGTVMPALTGHASTAARPSRGHKAADTLPGGR
jgi:hypothetical protein